MSNSFESKENRNESPQPSNEPLGMGLKIVCFLIPLVGIILYFVHKTEYPKKSQGACYSALWGFGFGIVLQIVFVLLGLAANS